MTSVNRKDWLISPTFIFLLMWSIQLAGYLAFSDMLYPFEVMTWVIVAIGVFSFCFGCFVVKLFSQPDRLAPIIANDRTLTAIKQSLFCFLILYISLGVAPLLHILLIESDGSISVARALIVEGISEHNNSIVIAYYLSSLTVVFAVYIISHANYFSRKMLTLAFVLGLFAGMMSSGRTLLLFLFSSCVIALYIQRKIRVKTIGIVMTMFIILFFAMAVLQNKGDFDDNVFEQIVWNAQVYFFNGLACFNSYVANNFPAFDDGILLPNSVRRVIDMLGIQMDLAPSVFPFVETPLPGNVYTSLYPWYHDAGISGVFFGFFAIGSLSQIFFQRRLRSNTNVFFYAVSVYALLMTVFEDQYLRAYPLWLMIFAIPVIIKVVRFYFGFKLVWSAPSA